uniref:Uncharacterized protein n=1 Tax=Rhizophora mucronata TaxID=61149 RepID=A0A2P2R2Q9_RHIMU
MQTPKASLQNQRQIISFCPKSSFLIPNCP